MSTIGEVEKLALDLTEKERATLTANLLNSLPGILSDEDEGIAIALRRNAEIEGDPTQGISLVELDSLIKVRRDWCIRSLHLTCHERYAACNLWLWLHMKKSFVTR